MTTSPIMALFREFEIKYRQAGDMSFDEEISSGLYDKLRSLEERIMALPAGNGPAAVYGRRRQEKHGESHSPDGRQSVFESG